MFTCLHLSYTGKQEAEKVIRRSPGSSVSLKAGRRAAGPGGGRDDRGSSWRQKINNINDKQE